MPGQDFSDEFDFTLGAYQFRSRRDAQEPPFQHIIQRVELQEQEQFSEENRGRMVSRADLRSFLQSNWSGGYAWWDPNLRNADGSTYNEGDGMDTWTRPGQMFPHNKVRTAATVLPLSTSRLFPFLDGSTPRIGAILNQTTASNYDVGYWDPATEAFIAITNITAGTSPYFHSMTFDPNDDKVYVVAEASGGFTSGSSSGKISRFDTTTDNNDWLSVTLNGPSELVVSSNELLFYDGDAWYTIDKSGPTVEAAIADDGLGPDILRYQTPNAWYNMRTYQLAATGPQGTFYVKNTMRQGGIQATVYRLDITDSGTWLLRKMGSLPPGMIVTHIESVLDSYVMLCSPDANTILYGADTDPPARMELWHITQGQIGMLGQFDPDYHQRQTTATSADFSPKAIVGVDGANVWLAAGDQAEPTMYVYSAATGGIHMLQGGEGANGGNGPISMAIDEEGYKVFSGYTNRAWFIRPPSSIDLATANRVISNVFDFGNPTEEKEIASFELHVTGGAYSGGTPTWTLKISPEDDGSWTTVTNTTVPTTDGVIRADLDTFDPPGQAARFRYEVRLDSNGVTWTELPRVVALRIKGVSGEMVEHFVLQVDATEIANLENQLVDPEEVWEDLTTVALTTTQLTFQSRFGKRNATPANDYAITRTVKIDNVRIQHMTTDEAYASITLTALNQNV